MSVIALSAMLLGTAGTTASFFIEGFAFLYRANRRGRVRKSTFTISSRPTAQAQSVVPTFAHLVMENASHRNIYNRITCKRSKWSGWSLTATETREPSSAYLPSTLFQHVLRDTSSHPDQPDHHAVVDVVLPRQPLEQVTWQHFSNAHFRVSARADRDVE